MSENDKSVREEGPKIENSGARRELLLALIQHGSRPAVIGLIGLMIFFWLFSVKEPLCRLISRTQELKVGSFTIRLRENVKIDNLGEEYKKLETLSLQQIQLFLIIGVKRNVNITYDGPEATKQNLDKLQEVGLLQNVREEGGGRYWDTTEKGERLYGIIFDQLVVAIRSG